NNAFYSLSGYFLEVADINRLEIEVPCDELTQGMSRVRGQYFDRREFLVVEGTVNPDAGVLSVGYSPGFVKDYCVYTCHPFYHISVFQVQVMPSKNTKHTP